MTAWRLLLVGVLAATLTAGCRSAPPVWADRTPAQSSPVPEPAEHENAFVHWARSHPALAQALAVGAAVGVMVLAGYLIYEAAKDGKPTPLLFQVGR